MFNNPFNTPKKKKYRVNYKVYANGKAIAEFNVLSHGHTRKQATDLAKEKLSIKISKAYLIKRK